MLSPSEELRHPAELRVGLKMPVGLYAMVHSAFQARRGGDPAALAARISELFCRLSEVAAENPDAWLRRPVPADEIRTPGAGNRMQAWPYTRMHCSNWSVDQAAALVLCSAGKARELGIPAERWIHPLASAESNHMMQVSRRGALGGCPGARIAGERALSSAGLSMREIDLIDLYSCFPAAVEIFAGELGIPTDRRLTVTGGMPFAGGPYNNYVLQATCRMADLLDANRPAGKDEQAPARPDLVRLRRHHEAGVRSLEQRAGRGLHLLRCQRSGRARGGRPATWRWNYDGAATVAGYTALHERGGPPRAIVIADAADGRRVVAESADAGRGVCGRAAVLAGAPIRVSGGQFFELS